MIEIPDTVPRSASAPIPAGGRGLLALIRQRPGAAFGAFLAVHFVVWTALPTVFYPNLPLDLIEALTYGREWVLGSYKLPPLPWWLVEILYKVFGVDAAYYALAEVVVIIAFALVWAAARPLVGALRAFIAILIIDGLHYTQYTAAKFNHDVIQLPFWALAGYAFHRALRRGRLGDWLLLGLAFGGAVWAKYFVVVLAVPYALFLLWDAEARRTWRTPGPWLGMALAALIASPHMIWLIENHFAPFTYVEARSAAPRGWFDHLLNPALFIVGQLFFMLPTLLIAATFIWPRPNISMIAEQDWLPRADAFDRRIVALIAFGPAAALMAVIVASGRGAITMWGYPLWLFCGLWIVLFLPSPLETPRLKRIIATWSAVFIALALAFICDYTVLPSIDHRYRAAFFPGSELATILTQRFHEASGGKKLDYVVGTTWLGGNLAHYSPDQPHVLIDGLPRRAPWVNLADLRAKGAVLLWEGRDLQHLPAAFAGIAPNAKVGKPLILPARRFGTTIEHIGWAILPPQQ
ncbi:MAG: glycosyltransferase family 39 protein [Xanthobacteraceae bacterium]